MIQNIRYKKPIISFGLGKQEVTIAQFSNIVVYQNEVYADHYELGIILPEGLSSRKTSNNRFVVVGDEIGTYDLNINFTKDGITIKSNTIKLIVE